MLRNLRACLETTRGAVFGEKAGWRDEGGAARGHHGATPKAFASRAKPDGLFPENPPGGGSFVRGRRWLGRHSPLRGCFDLAALATAKIPRRSAPRSFQTGSYADLPAARLTRYGTAASARALVCGLVSGSSTTRTRAFRTLATRRSMLKEWPS